MGIVYWSPLSIFVSLNKDKELEGESKFMFLFCPLGGVGALKILLVLRLLHMMNVRFSLLNMAQRILGVTLPNF